MPQSQDIVSLTPDPPPGGAGLCARLYRAMAQAQGGTADMGGADIGGMALPDARPAAVLLGFTRETGRLLLTKRAGGLRHHPGQVALPGGKVDAGDADVVAAALREAAEEVGLTSAEVLGALGPHHTITGFRVIPIVALIPEDFIPRTDPAEVDEAFFIPLSHLTPARFRMEQRLWQGGMRSYPVAPFGPYYIWGATARILLNLSQGL